MGDPSRSCGAAELERNSRTGEGELSAGRAQEGEQTQKLEPEGATQESGAESRVDKSVRIYQAAAPRPGRVVGLWGGWACVVVCESGCADSIWFSGLAASAEFVGA